VGIHVQVVFLGSGVDVLLKSSAGVLVIADFPNRPLEILSRGGPQHLQRLCESG
jgi:hypothetical protein